ncbi:MAG: TetR/AcrR family transcriptional regulator [Bdellovibrionota bacterium]
MDKESKLQWKEPRQSRSRAMVDAIFEATLRVLPTVGNEKLTTSKIAEVAGVSVGSLYQYFPSKDALVGAVIDMAMKACSAEIEKKIDEVGTAHQSIEASVNAMIDFMMELFLAERTRVAEIYKRAPELGRIQSLLRLRRHAVDRMATEFERLEPGLSRAEYERVAYICANSVMGVIHTALYDEGPGYPREVLGEELKFMLTAYLLERIQVARKI